MATHLSRSVSAAPLSRSESAELFPIPHPSRAHTSVCLSCELNFLLSLSLSLRSCRFRLRFLDFFESSARKKSRKKEKSYTTSDVAEEEKLQLNVIVAQRGAPANKLTHSLFLFALSSHSLPIVHIVVAARS